MNFYGALLGHPFFHFCTFFCQYVCMMFFVMGGQLRWANASTGSLHAIVTVDVYYLCYVLGK